jgi:hypothetical protein
MCGSSCGIRGLVWGISPFVSWDILGCNPTLPFPEMVCRILITSVWASEKSCREMLILVEQNPIKRRRHLGCHGRVKFLTTRQMPSMLHTCMQVGSRGQGFGVKGKFCIQIQSISGWMRAGVCCIAARQGSLLKHVCMYICM